MDRRTKTALRIAVSAALVAFILSRAELGRVFEALREADLRLVLLALALNPLGYLFSVSRWRLLLSARGGDPSFGFLLRAFLVGVFFNNLLPSTVGGDAVRALASARAGVSRSTAVATVLVDRFLGLLTLLAFALAGVAAAPGVASRVPALGLWLGLAGAGMATLAWALFAPSRRAEALAGRLPALLPTPWRPSAGRFLEALVAFRGRGGLLAKALAWSAGLQTLVVLNGWLLARAVGVTIPLAAFFVLVPLAVFVMTLPVSINGIGVRETVWAFFFTAYGMPAAAALGVAVAWLDVGLLLLQALVGGAVWALQRGELHRAGNVGVAGEARAVRDLPSGPGVEPAAEGTR